MPTPSEQKNNSYSSSTISSLTPSSAAISIMSPSIPNASRVRKNKKHQLFHLEISRRKEIFDAAEKDLRQGINQDSGLHLDALNAQHEEIAIVKEYRLTKKQLGHLYAGVGYTSIRRFLEEPNSTLLSLPVSSRDSYMINLETPEDVRTDTGNLLQQ